MSFWSEASGSTKGIIVAGALLVVFGLLYLLWPEPDREQTRGVQGGTATEQAE